MWRSLVIGASVSSLISHIANVPPEIRLYTFVNAFTVK